MTFFHGHAVVAATFLLNFVSIGTFNAAALFIVPLENTFVDAGRGMIDFLPTIYLAVALFTAMGAGWLQDTLQKVGARIEPVFGAGALCMGLGGMTSSFRQDLSGVLSGAIVTGIGIGLTGFTAAGVCVLWFQKNRGTMLLLAMAGQGLGGFVYCNAVQQLLNYYEDKPDLEGEAWRPAMRVSAIFSMAVAVVSSVFMRLPNDGEVEAHEKEDHGDNNEADTSKNLSHDNVDVSIEPSEETEVYQFIHNHWEAPINDTSKDYGTIRETTPLNPPIGEKHRYGNSMSYQRLSTVETMSTVLYLRSSGTSAPDIRTGQHNMRRKRVSSLSEFEALARISVNYAAAVSEALEKPSNEEPMAGLPYLSTSEAFYTRTSLSLLGWCFFSCFAYTNYVVHLPAFATSVGLSPEAGALALSLTGLTMLMGNITLGRATDSIGPIRMLQITMVLLCVIFFAWPYGTNTTTLTILSCLYGYAATTQGSVPLIIMADAFDSTSPDSILTLLGILNFAKFPGYLFGPTICGWLYDRAGDYYGASVFTGTIMLIGNLFLFALPSTEEQARIIQEKMVSDRGEV